MLVGIVGRMGQGKTLSMTAMGGMLSTMTATPLFANYTLSRINYKYISSAPDLWQAKSGIVLLDEFWLTVDSRNWKNNIRWSQWLNQTRKKDLLIFYTTQHIGQVDIRIRRATDWVIICEKKPDGIWLNFIEFQTGLIGKKIQIPKPQKIYNEYNTYEVLKTIQ